LKNDRTTVLDLEKIAAPKKNSIFASRLKRCFNLKIIKILKLKI